MQQSQRVDHTNRAGQIVSGIQREISRVHESIDRLEKSIAQLQTKTESVQLPGPPAGPPANAMVPEPMRAPLASEIFKLSQRVDNLCARLDDLTEHIEL